MKFFTAVLAISLSASLFAQTDPHGGLQLGSVPGAAAGAPVDPNKVVISIGDQKITAAEYDEIVASIPAQYQAAARGPGKRAFAEQLIQLKLLAAQAVKDKQDQDPKIKREIEFNTENLLANVAFQHLQETIRISDSDVEAYYNAHKSEYEEVKARHILIRVKGAPMQQPGGKPELSDDEALAKAKGIKARLAGGEDFATVAKAESDDTGSAAQGGEVGAFHKGMMVPPFETAAFAAKVGEVTDPVRSPFGYHIIKVEEHKTKPLSEARGEIEKKLRPEMARAAATNLQKNANVTLDDSFFGPAPAPRPATPAPTDK